MKTFSDDRLTRKLYTGKYHIKKKDAKCDAEDLIQYIGMLEDFIANEHANIWYHLNLKQSIWRGDKA